MTMPNNLLKRDGTYYARIYIPLDLQRAFDGKKEKWQSLRTKEPREARERLAAVLDEWVGTFADMRRRVDSTEGDIQAAVAAHYTAKVEQGDLERVKPTETEIWQAFDKAVEVAKEPHPAGAGMFDAINSMTDVQILANKTEWAGRRRRARLNRLRADLGSGDTRLMEPEADRFIREKGFRIAKSSDLYRKLCLMLMRGEIEALQRTMEREAGDFTGQIKDPIVAEAAVRKEASSEAPGETVLQLFAKYEKANPKKMQADSMKQVRRDVEHFAAFVGPRFPAEKIDRATVATWMDVLYEYPVKATETTTFKGLSPQEVVAKNKTLPEPKPTIRVNTIRRYMSSLGGFCRWLKVRSVLPENPLSDMAPERDKDNERLPFTDAQMKKLLTSPLFTGCEGDSWQDMALPGTLQIRDHRYWVPLVMAYSGARPGEIAQLQTADVREQHGIWIMHITELGEGDKRTKTEGSMRVVPIHSELFKLGFVEHCKAMVKAGHKQVFPEVEIPEVGQIIPEFSREMNRTYLPRIGLKKDRSIVVYSLRHTVVDRLRLAGVSEDEIGMLVGHDKPTMTGRYGVEQPGTLKRRVELVEVLKYR